tara:strand:+ start:16 stop:1665 length:1650 start_codon:yes stop_codon:yes gene_type:complete
MSEISPANENLVNSVQQRVEHDKDAPRNQSNPSTLAQLLDELSISELMLIFKIPNEVKSSEVIPQYVEPFIEENKPSEEDKIVLLAAGKMVQDFIQIIEEEGNNTEDNTEDKTDAGEIQNYKLESLQKPGELYNWLHPHKDKKNDSDNNKYINRYGMMEVTTIDEEGNHKITKPPEIGKGSDTQSPINPLLQKTTTHLMTLDSANRQYVMADELSVTVNPDGIASPTNYLMNFSHPLTDVLSYTLTSVSIPFTFYNIDSNLGNNFLYVDDGTGQSLVCIPSGQYDVYTLVTRLNTALSGFGLTITYDSTTHKLTFVGGPNDVSLLFYDTSGNLNGCDGPIANGPYLDANLGYILGFRSNVSVSKPISSIDIPAGATIIPPMAISLHNSHYFVLVIDDFNNNYVNMNQTIQNDTRPIIMEPINPSDLSFVVLPDVITNRVQLQPSAPRKLTNAQLTARNANGSYKLGPNVRASTREIAHTFAVLPFSTAGIEMGHSIVIVDGIGDAVRTFFGPTDIDKFRVRLVNRYGRTVNLNGNDWHFTMQVTRLYQY